MKKYFKIQYGFRDDQEITIEADELPKAQWLFLKGEGRTIFKDGSGMLAQDIRRIIPDYHTTMGWNKAHKMDEYDWKEVEPLKEQFSKLLGASKILAEEAIETNNVSLIEPESARPLMIGLMKKENPADDGIKELADKFKFL